ncbi:MAG: single-stranded-DNA-specific exonuclease RecJ [Flavobacteriaceae bacterium]|nr:single-stranded-DNA-specific exonuclease RecJ [Flavobacteriaceae bacterium]
MGNSWKLRDSLDINISKSLQEELKVSKIISDLLTLRGIKSFSEAKNFFRPELSQLFDPFLMKNMRKAVKMILKAIKTKRKIMIYGDYDVDGTTSVAILYLFLKNFDIEPLTYIPDRFDEGYGLSNKGINKAKDESVELLVVVDCGIKAIDQIELANSYGIKVIVCDHHKPSNDLPEAAAILNPKQLDCDYPYKELCGCGIVFKFIQAINFEKGFSINKIVEFLDFVAIAIVADLVPITNENRILASLGIKIMNKTPRGFIKAFLKNLNRDINTSDLAFKIGPRINASGRIRHANYSLELLTSKNDVDIEPKIRSIELLNSERRLITEKTTKQALDQIETLSYSGEKTSVVFRPDWNKGVIGIVASRLIEHYYRPTIVFTKSKNTYSGSARSVKNFDIYKSISDCSDHLIQFGGHKYAAGLTLLPEKYNDFKKAFNKSVSETISNDQLVQSYKYDLEVSLDQLTLSVYRIIRQMGPFGASNRTPIFCIKNCIDNGGSKLVGNENNHLKIQITDKSGQIMDGIGFEMGNYISKIKMKSEFDVIAHLEENNFNGNLKLQLIVKEILF